MGNVNFDIDKLNEPDIKKTRGIDADFVKVNECILFLERVTGKIRSGFDTIKYALDKQKEAISDASIIDSDMKTLEDSLSKIKDYYHNTEMSIRIRLGHNSDKLKAAVEMTDQDVEGIQQRVRQALSGGRDV